MANYSYHAANSSNLAKVVSERTGKLRKNFLQHRQNLDQLIDPLRGSLSEEDIHYARQRQVGGFIQVCVSSIPQNIYHRRRSKCKQANDVC